MRDFTLTTYQLLLNKLKEKEYSFQTLEEYFANPLPRVVMLRHDVDSWPANALQMAKLEHQAGAMATYYFRISPLSYNERIIRQIAALGHEIGYHYEDLSTCNGNYSKAIEAFEQNLKKFRKFYPVKTIAMHGKPLSRWNNLDLWKNYSFEDYGIIGEPYLSINFNKVLYLTDTGNCWDGLKYNLKDHVKSNYHYDIHSTFDLVEHVKDNNLPDQMMLSTHPSRWNDDLNKWLIRYYILTLPKYLPKKILKKWRTANEHRKNFLGNKYS